MEMEGLIKVVKHLDEQGLSMSILVTDRHCRIKGIRISEGLL